MSQVEQQKNDLLVIGELNMDLILNGIESFPEIGKEKIAKELNLTLGSSSAILAGNSARLGLAVAFCGMVGNDDFGEAVIDQLNKYGVSTSWITISDKFQTGLTAIIRQANDRAMVTYPGAMDHFSVNNIPDGTFKQARHLHMSSIFLQPGIKKDLFKIIDKAKSHNMTVSIDPQWDPDEKWDLDMKKLLNSIDFFLPNASEFLNFTCSSSVEEGFEKVKHYVKDCTIIVKRGTQGATFLGKGFTSTIPAFINKKPVDAVGAGDSFNAGFLYRFLRGDSIEKCIQFGNITGAISTTRTGGTAAITSLQKVLTIAKNKFSLADIDLHEFTT